MSAHRLALAQYFAFSVVLVALRLGVAWRIHTDSGDIPGLVLLSLTIGYIASLLNAYVFNRYLNFHVSLSLCSGLAATPWILRNSRGFQWTVAGLTGPAIDIILWVVVAWCAAVIAVWVVDAFNRRLGRVATSPSVIEN